MMNEQVNANDVISFLQQELTSKNLEVAILKAKLSDALAAKKGEDKPEEKAKVEEPQAPAQIDQEGEN